jgi:energy-converting hydrogenase Eha subunit H
VKGYTVDEPTIRISRASAIDARPATATSAATIDLTIFISLYGFALLGHHKKVQRSYCTDIY